MFRRAFERYFIKIAVIPYLGHAKKYISVYSLDTKQIYDDREIGIPDLAEIKPN